MWKLKFPHFFWCLVSLILCVCSQGNNGEYHIIISCFGRTEFEFDDRLSAFGDSMLGQFTRKHETYRDLDFTTRESSLHVVLAHFTSFGAIRLKISFMKEFMIDITCPSSRSWYSIGMDLF